MRLNSQSLWHLSFYHPAPLNIREVLIGLKELAVSGKNWTILIIRRENIDRKTNLATKVKGSRSLVNSFFVFSLLA